MKKAYFNIEDQYSFLI